MNILITGTSKGIGRELLKVSLNSLKYRKVFACTSTIVPKEFENHPKLVSIMLNYMDDNPFRDLEKQIQNEKIDVLINNSGYLFQEEMRHSKMSQVRKMFEVNFFGPFQLVQKVIPNLEKCEGQIINLGSMGGFQGSSKYAGLSGYSASKAALANLSECLAVELTSSKISVNCLALGAVRTEMLKKAFPDYSADVSPQAMAKYIMEFVSFGGKLVNGQVIPVSNSTP